RCNRIGNRVELELGAERARELRETHQRAEVTRGKRAGALLSDRLDLRARADPADRDRGDAVLARARQYLRGVALGAAVAEAHERVTRDGRRTPERAVGGRDG